MEWINKWKERSHLILVIDKNAHEMYIMFQRRTHGIIIVIAQLRYVKIPSKTICIMSRLGGINPYKSIYYSPKPRSDVYCFKLNFNISKLGYYKQKTRNSSQLSSGCSAFFCTVDVHW